MENTQYGYWLPPNFSTHGAGIDQLINYIHVFMVVLFVGWGAYLLYCLIKFKEKPGHKSDVTEQHFTLPKYLEISVVLIEVFMLMFFSFPIWAKYKTDFPNEKEATLVRMTAEQFAWNFHYPGKDGKFGKTKITLIDGTNPVGLDREDPDAKDDVLTINQLNIPNNKPVIIRIMSKDVIHSFSIPVMRVKQDTIPGSDYPIWFQPTQTGEFDIACAQLCGIGHYRMKGTLKVMPQEEYDAWELEERKSLGLDETSPANNGDHK